ncbi:ABC transporter ATP-binding protein [Nonomuraea sp. K274]|uniref:ABC transporter ATP-binding protein n=1 Tax=Nonomuraea cypriaca TaxID=1187855 RepID=A0A931ABV6_9ACTN|nr:ABC transporter ATP-binding protein [Nonomuraea cypriaca]MBF8189976.1 ABC transporter ATP-binding protein [Nonomuraea cypriaca]
MSEPILTVDDLVVEYPKQGGWQAALRGVSIALDAGESLGLVGESGSGKSTLALAMLGLLPDSARVGGSVKVAGAEVVGAGAKVLNRIRGREIGLVYQDALVSLNPVRNVGGQITEVIRRHRPGTGRREARTLAVEALGKVGITDPARRFSQYPHEFSGGMRQRVAIAMALAAHPRLLVTDEVTTALDVTVQAQVLGLLTTLRSDSDMAMIVVSHDLDVVRGVTERVAVMYGGRIVETGPTAAVFAGPAHPYTAGLIASIPSIERPVISFIPGQPPTGQAGVSGCAFAPRCSLGRERAICHESVPGLLPHADPAAERRSACHFSGEMPV